MRSLAALASLIDRINATIGKGAAWLTLVMVLVQFVLVIMRYVFGVAWLPLQESLLYAHALLFMLAAGYTLLTNGHVRVDIFYREASPRGKAWVDLFGVIFLLAPFCALLWITSWSYVGAAWAVHEGSRETSGIPGVYLLKSVILVFAVLLLLQGLSLAIRSLQVLAGADPAAGTGRGRR